MAIPSPRTRTLDAPRLPGRIGAVLLDVGGVFVLPDHAEVVAAGT
ncbi:MAG: hypothetical protein V2B17_02350 [Chloroflexota bacterium]